MSSILRSPIRAGLLAALVLLGCQNAENQAAKQRVFAPPPPDPVVEQAKVPIDLARLPTDDAYRLKVLSMLFPELHARAKAGLFNVKETLTIARGQSTMNVEEVGHIRFNLHGDMEVELRTGATEAMALVFANEVLYLRNRAGSWRASRDPRDERHFWADQTYAALRTTAEMIHPAMSMKKAGEEVVEGRKATRFELGMKGTAREPETLTDDSDVDGGVRTRVPVPDAGLLRAAEDRRRAVKGGQPQSITGSIVFDNATGVPLSVNLETSIKLAGRRGVEPSVMTIKLESTTTEIGKDVDIKPPAEAVEEIVRRRTPVNPLEFLDGGQAKVAPKEKKPVPAQPQEPADDEE